LAFRKDQFFITRFSTGSIFGYWSVIVAESFRLKQVDLSPGIQEMIESYGLILLGFGVICVLFNRASKILSKENKEEKTVTIEKAI
jgi:hypothetical protein